jgi:septum formation protein
MNGVKNIILASQSPRRSALLRAMGVEFKTIPSDFDEQLDESRDPELVARELALGKALAVAEQFPDAYVIGSDTIVSIDGRQLEKPTDEQDAHDMLKLLSGRENFVTTGLAVVCLNDNVRLTDADTTSVFFTDYDEQAVREYVATGDPMDKAGGYGIQMLMGTLISHIEGSYDTVVGLPTAPLAELLAHCGIAAQSLGQDEIKAVTG